MIFRVANISACATLLSDMLITLDTFTYEKNVSTGDTNTLLQRQYITTYILVNSHSIKGTYHKRLMLIFLKLEAMIQL